MDTKQVGRRIRELRLARGYSQERLAELSGTSGVHIGRLEHGATPSLPLADAIARALGVPLAALVAPVPGDSELEQLRAQAQALLGGLEPEQLRLAVRILAAFR